MTSTPISQPAREAASRIANELKPPVPPLEGYYWGESEAAKLIGPIIQSAIDQSTAELRAERDELRRALQQFADCDLNDSNCASLEVATARIRRIAHAALNPTTQKGEHGQ